jgi:hypothetical protein
MKCIASAICSAENKSLFSFGFVIVIIAKSLAVSSEIKGLRVASLCSQ